MHRRHDILKSLADLVRENYFDPATAAEVAAELEASTARLDEDNPDDFAQQLTDSLRQHDRHFRVQWGPWKPRVRPTAKTKRDRSGMNVHREGEVAILSIHSFENADEEDIAARAQATLSECATAEAVVIDVRDVPGGWPSMVEVLLGALTGPDPVPILTFHSREGELETWSRPLSAFPSLNAMPLAVLVNAGTASAAESFAYALQSLGRAAIVGERTAGAANPGQPFTSDTGFTIFISTASPRDPRTGTNWETTGVTPDVDATETNALGVALRQVAAETSR